jgi:hypothetical protein
MVALRLLSILLVLLAASASASDLRSGRKAWAFLTNPAPIGQWLVFMASEDGVFGTCTRYETDVSCEFPMWLKYTTKVRYHHDAPQLTPHPELPGSMYQQFQPVDRVPMLLQALEREGLQPYLEYNRALSSENEQIGTTCRVVVVLGLTHKDFETFVRTSLVALGEKAPPSAYLYRTSEE